MYLIAGLGNPEKKYIGTRHNTGFAAVEALCEKLGGLKLNETKFQGVYTKARVMTPAADLHEPVGQLHRAARELL